MEQPADKQGKNPDVPERDEQRFKRGPRPEPAKPKTSDPERDRYGSPRQQTDAAGRQRRDPPDPPNKDEYGEFLREDDNRDEPTRAGK
jgi:hypothetical protein